MAVLVPRYGLDIETDTSIDGLDPDVAAVVSVAVVGDGPAQVLSGPEPELLRNLDELLATLAPGVLVTWNGGGFDLPFLARRAHRVGVELGLRLRHDPRILQREPLAGCPGCYRARWYGHRHLDGYRVYRADVGASLGLSCGLKALARAVGLEPIEVDRTRIHELSATELHDYVASDAVLTRRLVDRRWATAQAAIDDPTFVDDRPLSTLPIEPATELSTTP
ncbi:MAG: 3'-5' exonuclease [Acidimicrobiales bacterium]